VTILTAKEAMTLLKLSPSSFWRAVRNGGIPVKQVSPRTYRFVKEALEQWMTSPANKT